MTYEANWVLANLVGGLSAQTIKLVQLNVLKVFIQNLKSPYQSIIESSIWGLGNICGDTFNLRNMVLNSEAI